jgi:hypothetical protein
MKITPFTPRYALRAARQNANVMPQKAARLDMSYMV